MSTPVLPKTENHDEVLEAKPLPRWFRFGGARGGRLLLSGGLVVALLLLTAVSVYHMRQANIEADHQRYKKLEEKLAGEIRRQIDVYRHGLVGIRNVFVGSESVDREEFSDVVSGQNLLSDFPAASVMGYVQRVDRAGLGDYIGQMRASGAIDYYVKPLSGGATYEQLFLVKYAEPIDYRGPVLGLDLASGPRRRAAAMRAMLTDEASITAQIRLVKQERSGSAFLIMLPCYAMGRPTQTPTQRREALEGWVYMTLLAEPFFNGIDAVIDHELDFRVFDSQELSQDLMLYSSADTQNQRFESEGDLLFAQHRFHGLIAVDVGGREWKVAMGASPQFQAVSNAGLWLAGVGGAALSILLGLMLHLQGSSLQKARELAEDMTADLRRVAYTDRLTGLPNRTAILDKVQDAIGRAHRVKGYHYAVLFLDFDRFKVINDSLGHGAGDTLLQQIGQRLRRALRPHDSAGTGQNSRTAARLGGDEFIVLLDGLKKLRHAERVAERLLQVLSKPYMLYGQPVRCSASIGVVLGTPVYISADEVVRDADTAMYEAKNAGRGVYKVFDSAMHEKVQERLEIENEMVLALEQDQFVLHYQPILDLKAGTLVGFEALVRWQHPRLGLIGPERFVPVAEETGFILSLGRWVLQEALRQHARWRRGGVVGLEGRINVNLSRRQLAAAELFDEVTSALREYGVSPNRLHLEVTESQIMEDPAVAIENLQQLRRVGVQIDIDDFGTGHSSLASLHEFPIDVLKIDRRFVANIAEDPSLVTVLRSVIDLATNLGVAVVAEGIETSEQRDLVRSLGCGFAQGYFFSRPVPADGVLGLIEAHASKPDRAA